MNNPILLICSFTLFAFGAPLLAQRNKNADRLPAKIAELDKNGDGKISPQELVDVLTFLGQEPSLDEAEVCASPSAVPVLAGGATYSSSVSH